MSIPRERGNHEKTHHPVAVHHQRGIRSDHLHPQPIRWRRNIPRTRRHDDIHAQPVRRRRHVFRTERNDHVHTQPVWGRGNIQWSRWNHHVHAESVRGVEAHSTALVGQPPTRQICSVAEARLMDQAGRRRIRRIHLEVGALTVADASVKQTCTSTVAFNQGNVDS
jgi:hypothetical protein